MQTQSLLFLTVACAAACAAESRTAPESTYASQTTVTSRGTTADPAVPTAAGEATHGNRNATDFGSRSSEARSAAPPPTQYAPPDTTARPNDMRNVAPVQPAGASAGAPVPAPAPVIVNADHARADADNAKRNERDRGGSTLTPMDQGNSSGETQITASIRKALVGDKALSFTAKNVKVITVGDKVTLRGPVKSDQERASIEATARRTAGVRDVDNQLEVKK